MRVKITCAYCGSVNEQEDSGNPLPITFHCRSCKKDFQLVDRHFTSCCTNPLDEFADAIAAADAVADAEAEEFIKQREDEVVEAIEGDERDRAKEQEQLEAEEAATESAEERETEGFDVPDIFGGE